MSTTAFDPISMKEKIEALLTRLRDMLYRAQTDPLITKEALLEVVDLIESMITDMVIKATSGQKILITVFTTFMQQEQLLREAMKELRDAIISNNIPRARMVLEHLRNRIYSYIRILYVVTAGKTEEAVEHPYTGIRIPKELSKNAFRVYALLLQQPGGEADLMTIQHLLDMSPEELDSAIRELERLGYIDLLIRGSSYIARLRREVRARAL